MLRAVLGLGSNLGARRAIFAAARALFASQPGCTVLASSRLYETPPLGPPQPDYLNGALLVEWVGSVPALFAMARHVEALLGRERRERWGPRTLDVDILYASTGPLRTPELEVPHAGLASRNFALAPLLDVWPELQPRFADDLARAGGPPPFASPDWVGIERTSDTLSVDAPDDEPELVSHAVGLLVSARGAPASARAALPFRVRRPLAAALTALPERIEGALSVGFEVRGAAVIGVDEEVLSGVLIGEQVGACARFAAPVLRVERRVQRTTRLSVPVRLGA